MVIIYTSPSCRSCAKAVEWLKNHHVPFKEKNLFTSLLEKGELETILDNSTYGFDSIISVRSDAFKSLHLDFDNLPISKAQKIIKTNPSILKRPIIIDQAHHNMQVGYNKNDIQIFGLSSDHLTSPCPNSNLKYLDSIHDHKKLKVDESESDDGNVDDE